MNPELIIKYYKDKCSDLEYELVQWQVKYLELEEKMNKLKEDHESSH